MRTEIRRALLEASGSKRSPVTSLSVIAAPSQKVKTLTECMASAEMTPMNSSTADAEKAKKYKEAEEKIGKLRRAREKAFKIVKDIYNEVSKEFPNASVLKKLAITKSTMNGVNLYTALDRLADKLGYVDPSQLGIYERTLTTKSRKNMSTGEFADPATRSYPIHDRRHVLAAIAYAKKYKDEKAKRAWPKIVKAAKSFDIDPGSLDEDVIPVGGDDYVDLDTGRTPKDMDQTYDPYTNKPSMNRTRMKLQGSPGARIRLKYRNLMRKEFGED